MIKHINLFTPKWMLILAITSISLFNSCNEDSFSQVVKIELPEHEPKIAMSALWLSQDTLPYAHVEKSRSTLEEDPQLPSDAIVKLYINGTFTSQAVFHDDPTSSFYPSGRYAFEGEMISGNEGDEYRLEASLDDLPIASAVQIMPGITPIETAEYTEDGGVSLDGGQVDLMKISFTDPADTEDYYQIQLFSIVKYTEQINPEDTIVQTYSRYLETTDPTITMANGNLLVSDKSFNGNTITIQGQTYRDWEEVTSREVHLTHITKDAYYYLKSVSEYKNSEGNPFAQPVTIYSNIENGYGIFGLGNPSKKQF